MDRGLFQPPGAEAWPGLMHRDLIRAAMPLHVHPLKSVRGGPPH